MRMSLEKVVERMAEKSEWRSEGRPPDDHVLTRTNMISPYITVPLLHCLLLRDQCHACFETAMSSYIASHKGTNVTLMLKPLCPCASPLIGGGAMSHCTGSKVSGHLCEIVN